MWWARWPPGWVRARPWSPSRKARRGAGPRPVQPLRLTYHQRGGRASTIPAFVGDDTLLSSFLRVVSAPPVIAHVHVEELQLPGGHRRDLAQRCQEAVRDTARARHEHALAA